MGQKREDRKRQRKEVQETIQSLLTRALGSLPEATDVFLELVRVDPGGRQALAERMHEVEAAADVRYLALLRKVGQSFITPYDREDIFEMVEALDDVVDQLDHAAHLLARFDLGELPPEFVVNAKSLREMAELSQQTVDLIKKPEKLLDVLIAINALANEMDARYRDLLVDLLSDAKARDVIKIKVIADCVADATIKLDHFGRAVGVMAIKET